MHGLAAGDARRLDLHAAGLGVRQRALAVDRLAERVDDSTEHAVADRHRQDAAGGLDRLAFLDLGALTEHHRTDRLLVEVQREAERAVFELEQLVDRGVGQARHAGDAVAHLEDAADLGDRHVGLEALEVLLQRRGDVGGVDRQFSHWLLL